MWEQTTLRQGFMWEQPPSAVRRAKPDSLFTNRGYFLLSGLRDELTLVVLSLLELSLGELSFEELSLEELSLSVLSGLDFSSFLVSFESPPPSLEAGLSDFFG